MCKTIIVNAWECDTGDELAKALAMPLADIPRSHSYPEPVPGDCCLCWVNVGELAARLADRYDMEQAPYDSMEYTFTLRAPEAQEQDDGK